MRLLWSVALLVMGASTASAQTWTVSSPDGKTAITVARQNDGALVWRVTRDGSPILADSPLGIRRADQSFDSGLTFVRTADARTIDERYQTPTGKRHDHHVTGREQTLTFANAAGAQPRRHLASAR